MLYADCMSQRGLASCLHQWKHDIYILAQAFARALTHRQLPFMDQFTCTVCLDLATCFRAWGYWMLLKEMPCKKKARVCNATDATDHESDGMTADDEILAMQQMLQTIADDASRLKMRVGGG